jgi:large conductance mechanosensitive channel
MRGNVIDLAVGVIIGAAFGAINSSLVGDIIMPIVGAARAASTSRTTSVAAVEVGDRHAARRAKKQGAVLAWGNFVTIVINFVIIAWVLFLVVRGINACSARKPRSRRNPPRRRVRKCCCRKSATSWRRSRPDSRKRSIGPRLLMRRGALAR